MDSSIQVPAPRTPLSLEVSFKKSYAREESLATLKNISLSGAFLEVPADNFMTRDKLHLVLSVGGRVRKLQAMVIWKNTSGCGVKFLPVNNRDVQIVDDLIYFVESKRSGRRNVLDNIFKKVS